MKNRKWIQLNTTGSLSEGILTGSTLNNASGGVKCIYCDHIFDAGMDHKKDEMFECPKCECRFKVSWLEVK